MGMAVYAAERIASATPNLIATEPTTIQERLVRSNGRALSLGRSAGASVTTRVEHGRALELAAPRHLIPRDPSTGRGARSGPLLRGPTRDEPRSQRADRDAYSVRLHGLVASTSETIATARD